MLSGGNVAFRAVGFDPSGGVLQHGIYLFDGSTLSRVADLNTAIPNGTGTFTGSFRDPVLSGDKVAIGSSQQDGIYLFDGSTLSRVADPNTAIPNGTGTFTGFDPVFGGPVLSGDNVAFVGFGSFGSFEQPGIYLFDGSTLSRVADPNTAIPNGTGTFTSLGDLALSGDTVAFGGSGGDQSGIYLFDGSTLSRVADASTGIPNGTGTFEGFGRPVLSGDAVAFRGVGSSGQLGIYLVTPSAGLTALSPAKVWVGLKNSDAVGLRLDLKAEVFVNDTSGAPIGTGQLNNVSGGGSGFNSAVLSTIPLALADGPVTLAKDDQLLLRVSMRRTCFGGGHNSGTARLWYNGKAIDSGATRDVGSRFGATVDESTVTYTYYLRTGFALDTTAGLSRTFIDKTVNSSIACPNRPFTSFGTWSTTP